MAKTGGLDLATCDTHSGARRERTRVGKDVATTADSDATGGLARGVGKAKLRWATAVLAEVVWNTPQPIKKAFVKRIMNKEQSGKGMYLRIFNLQL